MRNLVLLIECFWNCWLLSSCTEHLPILVTYVHLESKQLSMEQNIARVCAIIFSAEISADFLSLRLHVSYSEFASDLSSEFTYRFLLHNLKTN